jgi:hypothetical protein
LFSKTTGWPSASVVVPALVLARTWRKFADKLREELTSRPQDELTSVKPGQVLIVRSPGDEASGALAFSQFISWFTVRIYLWAQSLFARFKTAATRWAQRRWKVGAVVAAATIACGGSLVAYANLADPNFPGWLRTIALAGFFVSAAILAEALFLVIPFFGVDVATIGFRFLVSSLIWPMIFLLSIFQLPFFGWRIALANVLLDVTAETTPVGSSWIVHLIEPPASRESGKDIPPLMHSVIYENPLVLAIVCDWIAKGTQTQQSSR